MKTKKHCVCVLENKLLNEELVIDEPKQGKRNTIEI